MHDWDRTLQCTGALHTKKVLELVSRNWKASGSYGAPCPYNTRHVQFARLHGVCSPSLGRTLVMAHITNPHTMPNV